jgi:glycosyltransferase involved in cell wall biosynthesis
MQNFCVSAVIPTRGRANLLMRAVKSALAQTYSQLEIIVVIDGTDEESKVALDVFTDERLVVLSLPESVGGAEARNVGVRHARGKWIAFLDDDDEWMPDKIQEQVAAAAASSCEFPLVCSQVIARTPTGDFIWPENPPQKPYSEYLLVRSRLSYGEGLMQTSTLFAKRELLRRIAFRPGLRKHQDWDWVLRCTELQGVEVVFISKPLAVWYLDGARIRVSHQNMWRISLDWIKESRKLVTKPAYASFIANNVAPQAAAEKAWGTFFPLIREMVFVGQPRWRDLSVFLGAWFIPLEMRSAIRDFLYARHAARSGKM